MRGRVALIAVLAAVGIAFFMSIGATESEPELIIDETVAADFAAVAIEDWDSFVAAFSAHRECIGVVTLTADYDLDDIAKYDPETQRMSVRVPAPRVLLDRALIHELAHHLEFACPMQAEMRASFLGALGRSEDEWFEGDEWGSTPSEIFAEAVVEYVLDERGRVHSDIGLIEQSAVDVVVRWAQTP